MVMSFDDRKFGVMEPGLEGPSKKNLLSTSSGPMSTADCGCPGSRLSRGEEWAHRNTPHLGPELCFSPNTIHQGCTIDHLVMGRVESWDTLLYLPQYLCYLTENIYQCGSLHERTIYQVRIFFL